MANKITIYNDNFSVLEALEVADWFSMSDNLNEAPSSMKIKVMGGSEHAYKVNSFVYHDTSNSWWVIKLDKKETTLSENGVVHTHELQLGEAFEWFNYKHLPSCVFSYGRYTIQEMFTRLFQIANVNVNVEYGTIVDPYIKNDFFSFENYTLASAIKEICKSLNAIPKLVIYNTTPLLMFVSRLGNDEPIINGFDNAFPSVLDQRDSSYEQYMTRSIVNAKNVVSNALVIAPKEGGFKNKSDSFKYDPASSYVELPSNIHDIEYINLLPEISVVLSYTGDGSSIVVFRGYYTPETLKAEILKYEANFNILTISDINNMTIPTRKTLFSFNRSDTTDTTPYGFYGSRFFIAEKKEYNSIDDDGIQKRTAYFEHNTKKLILPNKVVSGININDMNMPSYTLIEAEYTGYYETISIVPTTEVGGFFGDKVSIRKAIVQVAYYPISDLKYSYDNISESNDEKYYNQTGKFIDPLAMSKLVETHTNDSAMETITRQAKHQAFSQILSLGQVVKEKGEYYIVSERAIDGYYNHYSVLYNLSLNRIARSENIGADGSIRSYGVPQDDLLVREHLYKDYIEFSIDDANSHIETPYMRIREIWRNMFKHASRDDFSYTLLVRSVWGGDSNDNAYYVLAPSVFDLAKSKYLRATHSDNLIIDLRQEKSGNDIVQTPIRYASSFGENISMRFVWLDKDDLINAVEWHKEHISDSDITVPFTDLTNVNSDFFNISVLGDIFEDEPKTPYYSMNMSEPNYKKDSREIPAISYQVQINDSYDKYGRIVIGDKCLTSPSGVIIYYTFNNTTRITNANIDSLSHNVGRIAIFVFNEVGQYFDITLLMSVFLPNTTELSDNHVAFYHMVDDKKVLLFAINDLSKQTKASLRIYVNNWRIRL